jgi:hypothetical protein
MGASKVREWDVSLSHHICKKTPGRVIFLHVGQQPARRGAERSGPVPAVCSQQTPSWRRGREKSNRRNSTERTPPHQRTTHHHHPRQSPPPSSLISPGRQVHHAHARRHHVSPWPPAVLLRRRTIAPNRGRSSASVLGVAATTTKRFVVSVVKSFFVSVSPVDTILRIQK